MKFHQDFGWGEKKRRIFATYVSGKNKTWNLKDIFTHLFASYGFQREQRQKTTNKQTNKQNPKTKIVVLKLECISGYLYILDWLMSNTFKLSKFNKLQYIKYLEKNPVYKK